MLDYTIKTDSKTKKKYIETSLADKALLNVPQLNKGTAFTYEERVNFNILGKLPHRIETLEEQARRCYQQLIAFDVPLNRNIYLQRLHDINEVLFFKVVTDHLMEILPVLYTPIVGTSVKQYSRAFRQARGLYISYPDRKNIRQILQNRSNPQIDLIVVTDGERVLGIGDQGIGGMDIPIAKLVVYTACGGIAPRHSVPVFLDVGTDNETLLQDPFYLGWRHKRIRGHAYDKFIDEFVMAVKETFPNIYLHWEDFGRCNANRLLMKYRDKICSFNDDEQGTGAVTLAAIMAGSHAQNQKLTTQQFVLFGGGTAGMGIARQLHRTLMQQGLSSDEAKKNFYIIDRDGLITKNLPNLTNPQKEFARDPNELKDWLRVSADHPQLLDVILNVKPQVLVGASSVPSAFSKEIIQAMCAHTEHPIILPLSNPTEYAEATPCDIYQWSDNKALVATGSPFGAIVCNNQPVEVAQCNNALIFPGIGIGVLATRPTQVTDGMLWQASLALAKCSPCWTDPAGALLPSLKHSREISKKIAIAVAQQAIKEKVATIVPKNVRQAIKDLMWTPQYYPLRRKPLK